MADFDIDAATKKVNSSLEWARQQFDYFIYWDEYVEGKQLSKSY